MDKMILVIQFRTDVSEPHDQVCIQAGVGEYAGRLRFVNAVRSVLPHPIPTDVAGIIFSGSGEFFLGRGDGADTWLPQTFRFIDSAMARGIPLLGLCFGHQILLKHQGADIQCVDACKEVGTFAVTMREHAAFDPIFSQLPATFKAMLGHQETPVHLPAHIDVFASSDRVEAQAIRVHGKDIWSTMFHPELTLSRMRERLLMFPHYVSDPAQFEATLRQFEDTPEAGKVLSAFVQYALTKQPPIIISDPPKDDRT